MGGKTLYDVVQELCVERRITVARLERELGFSNGSFSKCKDGTFLRADRMKITADYFHVSVDYLYKMCEDTQAEASYNKFKNLVSAVQDDAGYYTDPDVADIAQFAFENPQYKVLFDATKKVRPEDIDFVLKMIDRMTNYD